MEKENAQIKKIGIYIHIPFCFSKCFYCNFVSFPNIEEKIIDLYMKALIKQIKTETFLFKEKDFENLTVDTIYIGGGTPSYIKEEYIKQILDEINYRFNIEKEAEVTIEGNPESLSEYKMKKYKDYGINRISIGLQTTNDVILKKIGRPHTFSDFKKIYNFAKKYFRTNIDLMFALPNETEEILKNDLKNIINLDPDSISVYSLILEKDTKLYNDFKNKKIHLPNEELERKMQEYIYDFLEKNKYIRYEISNFSKKGKYSRHNTNTWLQHEYIGFGLNSSSYLNKARFSVTSNLNDFINHYINKFHIKSEKQKINKKPIYEVEEIQSPLDEMKEHIYLGLRMKEYDTENFFKKFNKKCEDIFEKEFKKIKKLGLIDIISKKNGFNKISLNQKGLNLANQVLIYFI